MKNKTKTRAKKKIKVVYPAPREGWCAISSSGVVLMARVGFGYTVEQAKQRAEENFIGHSRFVPVVIADARHYKVVPLNPKTLSRRSSR